MQTSSKSLGILLSLHITPKSLTAHPRQLLSLLLRLVILLSKSWTSWLNKVLSQLKTRFFHTLERYQFTKILLAQRKRRRKRMRNRKKRKRTMTRKKTMTTMMMWPTMTFQSAREGDVVDDLQQPSLSRKWMIVERRIKRQRRDPADHPRFLRLWKPVSTTFSRTWEK